MDLSERQFVVGSSVAQGVMHAYNSKIKVDGKWGSFTQNVYDQLSAEGRRAAEIAVAAVIPGSSPADYAKFRANQKLLGARMSISTDPSKLSVIDLIRSTSLREGVPFDAAYKFAWIESKLVPSAVSPAGAVGVFQIMSGALADVNRFYGTRNGRVFTMADMLNPVANVTVGIQYMKISARYAGVPVSDVATVYMAYNIGAGNLKKLQQGMLNDKGLVAAVSAQGFGAPDVYAANVSKRIADIRIA